MSYTKQISTAAKTMYALAVEIERLDKNMKANADMLSANMQKRDGLMVCLKQLAKEMK